MNEDFYLFTKNFSKYFLSPLFIFISIYSYIHNKKSLIFFIRLLIFLNIFNIIFIFLQFFSFDFAWELRDKIGIIEESSVYLNRPLIPGLAFSSLTCSYQIIILFSISLALFLTELKKRYLLIVFISCLSLIIVNSRSSLIVPVCILLYWILLKFKDYLLKIYINPKLLKKFNNLLIILIVITSLFLIADSIIDKTLRSPLSTIGLRVNLWLTGLYALIDSYGLGIQFKFDYQSLYIFLTNNLLFSSPTWLNDLLFKNNLSVHNSVILGLLKDGLFLLVHYAIIYFIIIKNIIYYKNTNKFYYYLFFIFFLTHFIHSFFHNSGIFTNDLFFWVVFSLLASARNLINEN